MTIRYRLALSLLAFLLLASGVQAAVFKIGSVAPNRSIWDLALADLALEWKNITHGAVQLKIYPGGIVGNESDMLTKMRLGTLGGGVFTNQGLNLIDRESVVFNTPFLMSTDQEFNYVFDRLKPDIDKRVEERGYKVIFWTLIGWEYFFSKSAVLYPEDMKKEKLSYTTTGTEMAHAWKKMGYDLVPTDLRDLLMALQSGMNTAFYLPPLVAGSGQFFALAPNMLDLRLAPIIGSLIMTHKAWNGVPSAYREAMLTAIDKISARLYQQTLDLDKQALKTMSDNGLTIHEPPADAPEKWRAQAVLGMDELVGKAFSKETYDKLLSLLKEYRQKSER